MQVVRLYFGSQEFVLPQSADVVSLKKRIVEAAAGPPAFVAFETATRASVSMLISADSTVRLESREVIDDGPVADPDDSQISFDEQQQLVFGEFEY